MRLLFFVLLPCFVLKVQVDLLPGHTYYERRSSLQPFDSGHQQRPVGAIFGDEGDIYPCRVVSMFGQAPVWGRWQVCEAATNK